MRNFHKIVSNINVCPLAYQVNLNEALFRGVPDTIKPGTPGYTHREAQIISMRETPMPEDMLTNPESYKKASDELFAANKPEYYLLSHAHPIIYGIMAVVGGTHLGRAAIARLLPGKTIYEHYDTGLSSDFYNRYHVILSGEADNWAQCGEGDDQEHVEMLEGECWAFNHRKLHSFRNLSSSPRVYLNLDISSA